MVGNTADEGSLFIWLAYSMGLFGNLWEPLVEATVPPQQVGCRAEARARSERKRRAAKCPRSAHPTHALSR